MPNTPISILQDLLKTNPAIQELHFNGNSLIFNGQKLDLTNFNIEEFLKDNPNFYKEITSLSPSSIFNILRLHVLYTEKYRQNIESTKPDIEKIQENFPVLQSFFPITNTNQLKQEKRYIRYIDENGQNHLLSDTTLEELIKVYHDLVNRFGTGITAEELYSELKKGKQEMALESLIDAQMRPNASTEHINNLQHLNNRNIQTGETLDTPLGNEKESLYLSHNQIYTFNLNENYQIVRQNHETREGNTDDEPQQEVTSEVIIDEQKISLITFEEYTDILLSNDELTAEQTDKILAYESFLFDIITYKDYLTPELLTIYQKYSALSEYLYQISEPNAIISETKERFEDMQNRSEKVVITNPLSKVSTLTRMNPNYKIAGFTSVTIYGVLITIVVGIIISLMILAS